MTTGHHRDADVIVVGGGPAGAALGGLLAREGIETVVIERGIHPGPRGGDALAPSTNAVFERLGLFGKLDDAGFVHRVGTAWNDPHAPPRTFAEIPLFGVPGDGLARAFTYHVERDELDTILLRHAHELGAKVLQGVEVREVVFREGTAVGVRARVSDGWERDLFAEIVVDASGREGLLADQLQGTDQRVGQVCLRATYEGPEEPPADLEGFTLAFPLGSTRSWAWQIPLKNGRASIGVVSGDAALEKAREDAEGTFSSLLTGNETLVGIMEDARRARPVDVVGNRLPGSPRLAGPGWMIVGDMLRLVDPIFLSGLDLALFSSLHASEAIIQVLGATSGPEPIERYRTEVATGVDLRHDLTSSLLQDGDALMSLVSDDRHRERIVGLMHGDPYGPESQALARAVLDDLATSDEETVTGP